MRLWEKMKGIRNIVKKVQWIYYPYKTIKVGLINKMKVFTLQHRGIEAIKDVEQLLEKSGFLYFADFGTLLGIVRDGNFISWDNDIDYGIVADNLFTWEKLEKIMNLGGYSKVRQFSLHDTVTEQTYAKNTLTIDFFLHEKEGNDSKVYGYFRRDDFDYKDEAEHHVTKTIYKKVEATKKVPFLGVEVSIPENAESFLESAYSAHWRIPDPNWADKSQKQKNVFLMPDLGRGEFYNRKN